MYDFWKGYSGKYDICLNATFDRPPEVSDLIQEVPFLADPTFQSRLLDRSCGPGVLGLELSQDLAEHLLERFKAAGSEGYCFPTTYHRPRITSGQAATIAAQAIEKKRLEYDPTDTLGPLFLFSDGPFCWTFGATSEQLSNKGLIPGALFAWVDKLDGHLWEWEVLRLLEEKYS
jgi:hypothetical protein